MTEEKQEPRHLSRNETHDLSMIIKDRAKVLKAYVDQQGAAVLAEFEKTLAAVYEFNDDEIWKKAMEKAKAVAEAASDEIAKRCEDLGIPRRFAPGLELFWRGRGENAIRDRQIELRRVAKTKVEAMSKACVLKIEQQSLDLRTQVVAMGMMSPDAKLFLESLAPVTEAMRALTFEEIEKQLETDKDSRRRRLSYDD